MDPWVNSPLPVSKRASMDLISAQWPIFRLSRFLWEIKQRAVTLNNFHKVSKKHAGFSRFKTSSWDVASVTGKSSVNQCLWSLHVSMQITAIMDAAWNKTRLYLPLLFFETLKCFPNPASQWAPLEPCLGSPEWRLTQFSIWLKHGISLVNYSAWPQQPQRIQERFRTDPNEHLSFPCCFALTVAMWWALGQKTRCLGLWGPIYLIFLPSYFSKTDNPPGKGHPMMTFAGGFQEDSHDNG